MAIGAEVIIKREADSFEREIDKKLAKKKTVIFTAEGDVVIYLSRKIPNKQIEEELIRRYEEAGWEDIIYNMSEGTYRFFLTPKNAKKK